LQVRYITLSQLYTAQTRKETAMEQMKEARNSQSCYNCVHMGKYRRIQS